MSESALAVVALLVFGWAVSSRALARHAVNAYNQLKSPGPGPSPGPGSGDGAGRREPPGPADEGAG